MKRTLAIILFVAGLGISARATTPLAIGHVTLIGLGGPCWDDTLVVPSPPFASTSFTLSGVTGTGTITSSAQFVADNLHGQDHEVYHYNLDMSGMGAATNHCIRLLIHFGPALGCTYNVLLVTNGTGSIDATSATLAPFGDVNFLFGSGCLGPGQAATPFAMVTDAQPRTNYVTIIDDFTNPGNGQTNETRINVTAIVPDIPPNWAYAPQPLPNIFFQGDLVLTNQSLTNTNISGAYGMSFQLVGAANNGLAVSPVVTQAVQVVNGLINAPLPFDPGNFSGNPLWLSMSVKPPGSNTFTQLNPPLPLAPSPQALYAYSAGVVADILPGQAVTSLNGITGNVILQQGPGILISSSSNTITITATSAIPSDRNLKTGFAEVKTGDILSGLTALPIQSWRYTNEADGIRHVGPMAQDFKAVFGLGTDDKSIAVVDEGGVALAAIQGLNRKVESENSALRAENAELKQRLETLEKIVLDHDHK